VRIGLSTRVFLLVAGLNALIFASAGAYLFETLRRQGDSLAVELTEELVSTLRASILPGGANVARILDWPGWTEVEDAFLVDANLGRRADQTLEARGVALNPVGAAVRRPDLALGPVLEGLDQSIRAGRALTVAGGRAVPILSGDGVWGACWFRLRARGDLGGTLRLLVPWFGLSTLLLTAGTFLAVRRLVLVPVERLAAGARELSEGRLSTEVPRTGRRDELDELVESFNGMAARVAGFNRELGLRVAEATTQARRAEQAAMIQRRLAAMGELAAGIAHEINNPLGGLQNAVATLRRPEVTEDRRRRYLDLLDTGLEKIRVIVGQVLRMAPRDVRSAEFDLRRVIEDALALVRHRAEDAGARVEVRVEPGLTPAVVGSRNELGQAVLNLLANALDALETRSAAGPGSILVELVAGSNEDGRAELRLSVVDDGPGAPPEVLERATDLFFSTKEVGRGTGLGLAIVHNIADTHGGRLELSSELGRGFRATLVLPAASREAVADTAPPGAP
jgi:signal transduction histidine kinase